jgi:hypothetical protein
VTAAASAMFAKLAGEFGITISNKTIMLVMNEIIPQLVNIKTQTPDEIANNAFDGKSQQDLEDKMNELLDNQNNNNVQQKISALLAQGLYTKDGNNILFKR